MPFIFENVSSLQDLVVIKPRVFPDKRGYFMETYQKESFFKAGITHDFVQDNHSLSSKGTLRGIHFQKDPMAQGKLVRVISGAVWDLAVDLRPESATYGQWYGLELSETNQIMFYIPPGFGHGFLTLSDNTQFLYKCTENYSPAHDGGIKWNDPDLAIKWPLETEALVSEKDALLPSFADYSKEFGL